MKKTIISLGTAAIAISPIVVAVSCGGGSNDESKSQVVKKVMHGQEVKKYLEDISDENLISQESLMAFDTMNHFRDETVAKEYANSITKENVIENIFKLKSDDKNLFGATVKKVEAKDKEILGSVSLALTLLVDEEEILINKNIGGFETTNMKEIRDDLKSKIENDFYTLNYQYSYGTNTGVFVPFVNTSKENGEYIYIYEEKINDRFTGQATIYDLLGIKSLGFLPVVHPSSVKSNINSLIRTKKWNNKDAETWIRAKTVKKIDDRSLSFILDILIDNVWTSLPIKVSNYVFVIESFDIDDAYDKRMELRKTNP